MNELQMTQTIFWWTFFIMYGFAILSFRVFFSKESPEVWDLAYRGLAYTIFGVMFEGLWLLIYMGN